MANLMLTFSDIFTRVSDFLGMGLTPTGADLTKVKDIAYRGYRRFLFPIDPRSGRPYVWSFRNKTGELRTSDGEWKYELPEDFSYFTTGLKFVAGESYTNPEFHTKSQIYSMRTGNSSSGYPRYIALRTGDYSPALGQRYELISWPTADAVYNYMFDYVMFPDKPTDDDDVFIGGPQAAECIMEMALAVAELQEDDIIGVHNQTATTVLYQMIGEDYKRQPKQVGLNLDSSVLVDWSGTIRPETRINDVSY